MQVTNELIQKKAIEVVGTELHDVQIEWVHAIIAQFGIDPRTEKVMLYARRAGYTIAYKVAMAIIDDVLESDRTKYPEKLTESGEINYELLQRLEPIKPYKGKP